MRNINLAINAVNLAPGGSMVVLIGYLQAWKHMDTPLEITLYASRQTLIDAVTEIDPHIKIIPFALGQSSRKHFYLQQTKLGPVITKDKPDVLLTTQYGLRNCSIPQFIHHQNLKRLLYPTVWPRIMQRQFAEMVKDIAARTALKNSPCNIFISEYMKKQAEKFFPHTAPTNHVLYNGLPDEIIKTADSIKVPSQVKPNIAAIQDTQPHKDNPTLIRTLHHLTTTRPEIPWTLNIAGGGNWTKTKRLAEKLGVIDRINFLGYLNPIQLNEILKNACCLAYTSTLEGFGIPPLEAMANGCPVVASNCTAIPEITGTAAQLVTPGKPKEFANAIITLYQNKFTRVTAIEKGFQQIKKFNWHNSARKMFNLFEKISEHHHA